jgi:hypothetical protein
MNKRAQEGVNWTVIGFVLALLALAILAWIFRDQILTVVANLNIISPKNNTLTNLSNCINNPGLPECQSMT